MDNCLLEVCELLCEGYFFILVCVPICYIFGYLDQQKQTDNI